MNTFKFENFYKINRFLYEFLALKHLDKIVLQKKKSALQKTICAMLNEFSLPIYFWVERQFVTQTHLSTLPYLSRWTWHGYRYDKQDQGGKLIFHISTSECERYNKEDNETIIGVSQ